MRVCPECKKPVTDRDVQCPDDGAETRLEKELPEGTILDAWRVVKLIGRGGMGEVYEARHDDLNKSAAIKLLPKRLAKKGSFGERFIREAKAASAVHHASIISIYDLGRNPDGSIYMVMELLPGKPLEDLLKGEERMPLMQAIHIANESAQALGAAHDAGIVHRDFKPGNVFVLDPESERPRVKVLDFGIAFLEEAGAERLTRAGTIMGTPHYMSPEQAMAKQTDARSDIYSWGCVTYHMITGQTPFQHKGVARLLAAQAAERPELPSVFNPDIPPQLDNAVMRAMEKDPGARYQGMRELVGELTRMLPQDTRIDLSALAVRPSLSPKKGLPGWLVPTLAVAALAAAGALYWMVSSVRTRGPDPATGAAAMETASVATGSSEPLPAPFVPGVVLRDDGAEALALLREAVGGEDERVRAGALDALGRSPSTSGMALSVEWVATAPEERVRGALLALGRGRSAHASAPLKVALEREEPGLRLVAAAELARAGDDAGKDVLLAAAARSDLGQDERAFVGLGLATLGERRGVELLEKLLVGTGAGLHPAIAAEAWALVAAGGDRGARGRLRGQAGAGDPLERLLAAEALLNIGDLAGRGALVDMLGSEDAGVRIAAANALANRRAGEALPAAREALGSSDPEIRRMAAATLGKMGVAIAQVDVDALVALMKGRDEPDAVRMTAAAALLAIHETTE